MTGHDCDLQENPVCPHCGHIERDAWEIDFGPGLDGDTEIECERCEKVYRCDKTVTIRYTSCATEARKEGV